MAWNVAVGSPTEESKSLKDEGSEHVLALVSHELSPASQGLVRLSDGGRGTLRRPYQSVASLQDDLEDDEIVDDQAQPSEKKRRLTPHQVKYLEMNFETENKLGPERKALIAHHLGLRPRQVAIWFQNRRARWKNKQLEQDYESLKVRYEGVLKENEKVMRENEKLLKENEAVLEENKRLRSEVARIMTLLQASEDLLGSGNVASDLRKVSNEQTAKLHPEDGSLVSAKSELASPTKSEDLSEIQDSGRSYPIPTPEVVASENDQVVMMADFNEAPMMFCSCPVVKMEDPTFVTPEDQFGNLFNPFLFQNLAASGVCFEEAYGVLCGWDEQFSGFSVF